MTHVATLISRAERPAVTSDAIATAAALIPGAGAPVSLDPGIAADIPCGLPAGADPRAWSERLRAALAPAPIDVVVQPAAGRRKRLFLTDMDSTVIEQECIDELADLVGLKTHVAAITERAMRGEIEFEPALRERVALLKGLPASVIDEVLARRITLMAGAAVLVATMRAHGAHTFLVSGGFTLFTAAIAARLGFHEHRANRLEIADGKLTGAVAEPILGRDAKLATLRELTARLGLSAADTLVAGDGANDIAMIAAAGLGVAYHAKPKVAAAAAARIDHGDLTALLYAQGYRRADFIVPASAAS
jgi:phosphoserine phosphatase